MKSPLTGSNAAWGRILLTGALLLAVAAATWGAEPIPLVDEHGRARARRSDDGVPGLDRRLVEGRADQNIAPHEGIA